MGKQMKKVAENGRTLALLEQIQRLDDEKRRVTDYCKQLERFKAFVDNMGWCPVKIRNAHALLKTASPLHEARDEFVKTVCEWVDEFIEATTPKEEKEPENG